jgi:hypothetical protein
MCDQCGGEASTGRSSGQIQLSSPLKIWALKFSVG